MSAHNEEKVIENKLNSLLSIEYPDKNIFFYLGSDGSTDSTNEKLSRFSSKDARIKFFPSSERRGKPGMINFLWNKIQEDFGDSLNNEDLLILTDADILHEGGSFLKMASHFYDPRIGLVDSHLLSIKGDLPPSTNQMEEKYMGWEIGIKSLESRVYGRMMGPFGGCFAMRAVLFQEIPATFLVDDFYLSMNVLNSGYYAIIDLEALAFESRDSNFRAEYFRKKRISAGNFQNLFHFKKLLFSNKKGLSYSFFSHKVLRWLSPFLLVIMGLSMVGLLVIGYPFFIFAASWLIGVLCFLIVVEKILNSMGISSSLGLQVFYFLAMNIALLHGFIEYTKGIKNNVWQPTERNNDHGN
jgi:cellulose synthase/poly-beta-1,6-N-acetylglucosamine synthase-like glycosyltransferase